LSIVDESDTRPFARGYLIRIAFCDYGKEFKNKKFRFAPMKGEPLVELTMNLSKAVGRALVANPERRQEADADWTLVQQVQAGEVDAFDHLVLRYRERIYGVVYNLVGNREDAADLTQDVFIKAFQAIHRFAGDASFFTWLYRIGINAAYGHLRRNRLRQFFSLNEVNEHDQPSAEIIAALTDHKGADKDTYVGELQEKLNEAMHKLSIKHRTVVTLFEIDGLSHQEIAEVMGCSEGTVRSRLHYAKQLLQSELQAFLRK
jgi:RNA polymerase sigma-70 factor, ECF subfamily